MYDDEGSCGDASGEGLLLVNEAASREGVLVLDWDS